MNWLGLAATLAALVLLLIARRAEEYDGAGNPALKLRPPAAALLPVGLYFVIHAVSFRFGETYRLHPFTFYALLTFGVLFLLLSAAAFTFRMALEPRAIVQSIPLVWRRSLPLSQMVEIQEDPLIPIVRFAGGRQITILPLYSGVNGFLEYLRQFHAELPGSNEN